MERIPPKVAPEKAKIEYQETSSDNESAFEPVKSSVQTSFVNPSKPLLREPSATFSLSDDMPSSPDSKALEDALSTLGLDQDLQLITDAMLRKAKHKKRKMVDAKKLDIAEKIILEAKDINCKDKMASASQITDQIYLGPHTVARSREELAKLGITSIISMTAECGIQFPEDDTLQYCFLAENLVEHTCTIEDVLDILDDVVDFASNKMNKPEEKIFIHCVQGKTRSAAATAFILAKTSGQSIDQAYEFIKSKRDVFIPKDWLTALQHKLDTTSS